MTPTFLVSDSKHCLLAGVALSGILCVLHACFDMKETIAGKHHYMLYFLAAAMKPR